MSSTNYGRVDDAGFSCLVTMFKAHVLAHPDKAAFVFITRAQEQTLSFAELDKCASNIASTLLAHNLAGQNVLLVFTPGLEFIKAFLGCLYANVIPVPVNTPTQTSSVDRFEKIVQDAAIGRVLTTADLYARYKIQDWDIPALLVDEVPIAEPDFQPDDSQPGDVAFIQYTSGSTGDPKGAVITHGNLISNLEMIKSGFGNDEHIVGVNWLPLFHDMGLVGNVLQPIWLGITCIHMSPLEFVQKPVRWLRAISDYKGTTSGGPTFGYAHCLARIKEEDCAGLDLSSWRLAYCGAEPVNAQVLDAFAQRFAPFGFNASSFYPCYGMAETTLIVTGPTAGSGMRKLSVDRQALADGQVLPGVEGSPSDIYVSNGKAINGQRVVIVHPEGGGTLAENQVGEVWVAGSSIAAGYLNNPSATAQRFACQPEGGSADFYRTGDLGFLRDGELYITGRLKDVIILRGRNYYPQDIEQVAYGAVAGLREGCGVAFSTNADSEEQLVIVYEVEKSHINTLDKASVTTCIRQAVINHFGVSPHRIILIKPKGIPKTSSGKLRRSALAQLFTQGALEAL
ncbi:MULTISPECIES: fatty acyl-AMP ligase [unclassified Pseudomonas]|uniref:fatty acyl-AMP ligase n=1 Tax=unclassified Pseudomonas TaxID=196821 RepID=UPI0008DF1235|nr:MULTISPECIES: fatty acyl-AMP ligase [unclassified Pseudomonas]PMV23870.1 AMP-dependent synthetase [Pseudomonas sp. FW305-3-2-15-C-TSA2]PMV30537.1 AMP-dependent synthetase [Pseudomonas sp. DP16D-L5]PMV40743.1 AMP-dependent synthetase [Pseudomonas sp. FW305-3-2-15-A-LB2]PMV47603.1 AMP-dependent synthetase [Pseudomonas sp. FW305-3-2-15-C-R2A1]PMV53023.1 AMP-dependent synthetase [Pseudomonas sp. FW305-3-2-15-C-LB1]